jgi:hypothetical protein
MASRKRRAPDEEKEEPTAKRVDLTERARQVILENIDTLALLQSFASARDKITVFRLVSKTWAAATRSSGAWHSISVDDGALLLDNEDDEEALTEREQPYVVAGVRCLYTENEWESVHHFPHLVRAENAYINTATQWSDELRASLQRVEALSVSAYGNDTPHLMSPVCAAIPNIRVLYASICTTKEWSRDPEGAVALATLAHLHTLCIVNGLNDLLKTCAEQNLQFAALETLSTMGRPRTEARYMRTCPRLTALDGAAWNAEDVAEAPLCTPHLEYLRAILDVPFNKAAVISAAVARLQEHGHVLHLRGLAMLDIYAADSGCLWNAFVAHSTLTVFEDNNAHMRPCVPRIALADQHELRHVRCDANGFAALASTAEIRTLWWEGACSTSVLARAIVACPRLSTLSIPHTLIDEKATTAPRRILSMEFRDHRRNTNCTAAVLRALCVVPDYVSERYPNTTVLAVDADVYDAAAQRATVWIYTTDFFERAVRLDKLERK